VLLRSYQSKRRTGMGSAVRHRRDVSGFLEMAEPEPGWICNRKIIADQQVSRNREDTGKLREMKYK